MFSMAEDLANVRARAILVNSKAVARDVEANERGWRAKIRLIYNGVDIGVRPARLGDLFPELAGEEDRPVVTYVANFHGYKGHEDLVDAAGFVAREIPDILFLMVGRDAGTMAAVQDRRSFSPPPPSPLTRPTRRVSPMPSLRPWPPEKPS
jgi:glycosyltransferase involved in cell wall biosynthesis